MKTKKTALKKLSFEAALTELNETLESLETGDLPLAEAVNLYEYGMSLIKQCNQQLDTVELRLQKLTADGELAPFEEA